MRELIDLIDTLTEASNLSASEISKYPKRIEKFLDKIAKGDPFTTLSNQEVVIDPTEAQRFADLIQANQFRGNLKARTVDGAEIPLSQLAKTGEFGGAAVAVGQEATAAGKEALLVKPSQIGICDADIPAGKLGGVIAKNSVLASTPYGKIVIGMSQQITKGAPAQFSAEYTTKEYEKVRKAIVDYAGEYLGVLALVTGRSNFPRRDQFLEWLGGSISDLTINFPSKANTNIADSYARITNKKTEHTLNISSKGTGGGAAPAISGLKISDETKRSKKLKNAVAFIELCQRTGTIEQAFEAIDFIYKINPSSIDKRFHKILPMSKNPELPSYVASAFKSKTPLPKKYASIYADIRSDATDAGKLIYAIKKEVASAINTKDAIPEFKETILQVLEMNFVQQYADYDHSQATISFETQWPAKLHGEVSVVNKSSAKDPTSGGFSFKLGRVAEYDDNSNPGAMRDSDDPLPMAKKTRIKNPKAPKTTATRTKRSTVTEPVRRKR